MQQIAVFGVTGRMGQSLVRALRGSPRLRLCAAVASVGSARLGQDAAAEGEPTGVKVGADAELAVRGAAVAVDFSLPLPAAAHAAVCAGAGVPLLVGATGLDAGARRALDSAAERVAVLIAPNTSVGVNVMARLVWLATRALGEGYDVDIAEAHHRAKRDAPSGTALALGEAVAAARGRTLASVAVYDRQGISGPRTPGSIGFAVVRAGDIIGEHTVIYAGDGERLEITHRAGDRATFAHGALRAAEWLAGKPAGLYGMENVLGLDIRS
jgi:4-hydroxy-tetrahydrodipicolinate reductase